MRTITALSIALIGLATPVGFGAAQVTDSDSPAIVDQATARMNKSIAYVRKTGRHVDVKDNLMLAESEFTSAYRSLSTGVHHPKATLALLRSADCVRIVQRWAEARDRYRTAIELARSAHETEYEAKAWFGVEKVERIGFKDHGAALDAIDHALRLARSAPNLESLEGNILVERADLELVSGNPSIALETLDHVIAGAQRTADKDLLQSALYSRSDVKHSMADSLYGTYSALPYKTPKEWMR